MIEYFWWIILVSAAATLAFFSSTAVVKEQRRIEWESYAREHKCIQAVADREVWVCSLPTPATVEVKE